MKTYKIDGDTQVCHMITDNYDVDNEETFVDDDKVEWVKKEDVTELLKINSGLVRQVRDFKRIQQNAINGIDDLIDRLEG